MCLTEITNGKGSDYGSFLLQTPIAERALRMLMWDEARVMTESMWGEKVKWVSKVNPIKYAVFSSQR